MVKAEQPVLQARGLGYGFGCRVGSRGSGFAVQEPGAAHERAVELGRVWRVDVGGGGFRVVGRWRIQNGSCVLECLAQA